MRLYYAETLAPRKACAVARYLNAEVQFVFVDLARGEHRSSDFTRLNPNNKVPVLVEGDRCLWEANAIMCHLAQSVRSPLWPSGHEQSEVIRWLSWDAAQLSRFGGELYFQYLIKPHLGLGPADAVVVSEAQQDFRRSAAVLDTILADRQWVVGDQLTIADFALSSTLPYALEAKIPFSEFSHVNRWHSQLCGLEGWRNPFPFRPPNG